MNVDKVIHQLKSEKRNIKSHERQTSGDFIGPRERARHLLDHLITCYIRQLRLCSFNCSCRLNNFPQWEYCYDVPSWCLTKLSFLVNDLLQILHLNMLWWFKRR